MRKSHREKTMNVRSILILEGLANLVMMLMKFFVGLSTNSVALVSDALHSMVDLMNNVVAIVAIRLSEAAPDEGHHYGHRKIEQLVVFGLAMLLVSLAIQIFFNAIGNYGQAVTHSQVGLWLILIVFVINLALTIWQHYWAKRLDSDILEADAKHTLSDVLTTIAAIAGWQFAANGFYWMDTLVACVVASLVLFLAWQLMTRSVPILIDYSEFSPAEIDRVLHDLEHVDEIKRVRARTHRKAHFADITIAVDPNLPTAISHEVTQQVERALSKELGIHDVVVHVEPIEK